MLDPHSGVALHRQLADSLRARILAGEWLPGALLPGAKRLSYEYSVGKATVQAATNTLRAEGLIEGARGLGMRVRGSGERDELAPGPGFQVSARMPTPRERAEHGLPDGVPVLVLQDDDGIEDVYPADGYVVRT